MIKLLIQAGALRQYRTSDGEGVAFGYDRDITDQALAGVAATAAQDALDARRYRLWRDAMLFEDTAFVDAMQRVLPPSVGADRPPTAAEWDAALDAVALERGSGS